MGTPGAAPLLMPAMRRYSGQLYRSSGLAEWNEPDSSAFEQTALIVSGLYGLVAPAEPIRDYDCWMNERLPSGMKVAAWWRRRGLGHWLRSYIEQSGVKRIYSFLPAAYAQSIGGLEFDSVDVHHVPPLRGSQSMSWQGDALRRLFLDGQCSCDGCRGAGGSTMVAATAPKQIVVTAAGTSPAGSLTVDASRVAPVARALASLPTEVWEAIDRGEPEWPVLDRLTQGGAIGVLAGIALGLSDYQLGAGGAAQYWTEVGVLLDKRPAVSTPADVRELMAALLSRPVAARLAKTKLARVDKLLDSALSAWVLQRDLDELGANAMTLWGLLANAMGQSPDAKTVAFAMKIVDLMHMIKTDAYIQFPADVPIVADFRVARVSLSCGLLRAAEEGAVSAMSAISDAGAFSPGTVRTVWAEVAKASGTVSLFRIDSLVWQVGEPLYAHRADRPQARGVLRTLLEAYGADVTCAENVADELTFALRHARHT